MNSFTNSSVDDLTESYQVYRKISSGKASLTVRFRDQDGVDEITNVTYVTERTKDDSQYNIYIYIY